MDVNVKEEKNKDKKQEIISYVKEGGKNPISTSEDITTIQGAIDFLDQYSTSFYAKSKKGKKGYHRSILTFFKDLEKGLSDEEKKEMAKSKEKMAERIVETSESIGKIGGKVGSFLMDIIPEDIKNNEDYKVTNGGFTSTFGYLKSYINIDIQKKEDISPFRITIFVRRSEDPNNTYEMALELWDAENNTIDKEKIADIVINNFGQLNQEKISIYQIIKDGNQNQINTIEDIGLIDPAKGIVSTNIKGYFRLSVELDKNGTEKAKIQEDIKGAFEKINGWYEMVEDVNIIGSIIDDNINDGCKQIVLTGAPGTGKTFSVKEYVKKVTNNDDTRMKCIQFHPSYDYTDFVEGIRPISTGSDSSTSSDSSKGEIQFRKLDGEFKKFCRAVVKNNLLSAGKGENDESLEEIFKLAKSGNDDNFTLLKFKNGDKDNGEDSEKKKLYYFIIDEINRADLSKVLGELMYGLEYCSCQSSLTL